MTELALFDAGPPRGEAAVTSRPSTEARGQTTSLYRKYRPTSFEPTDLVGQDHIVRTLRNAIQSGRIAHAYLFCGPRGTGKTTTARLLAKAANCLHPEILRRPCNECAHCIAINTGATADVLEIDAASNRGIDDIRELRERVKYAPTQLQYKFYIIDEAHQITGAAANAFLKTLEEPPIHTKFVLATTDPEELLPTIVSRCQRFDFRRVGIDDIAGRLRTVATTEAISIDDDALLAVARHATGSLRDALGILDQLAVFVDSEEGVRREVTSTDVLALLGISRNERVERIVDAIADRSAGAGLSVVRDALDAGEDPRQLTRQLVGYLRLLMHERAGGSPDADERARQLAARFDLEALARLANTFAQIDSVIRVASMPQLPLEVAIVQAAIVPAAAEPAVISSPNDSVESLVQPPRADPLDAPPTSALRDKLRARPPAAGSRTSPGPRPVTAIREEMIEPPAGAEIIPIRRAAPPASADVGHLAELWPAIRADVKAVNRRIEALLASVDPVAVDGDSITIATPYDFHRKRLNDPEVRRTVDDVMSRQLGRSVTVTCVLRDEFFAPAQQGPAEAVPAEPNTDGDDDIDEQRIRAAKNILDAEELTP